MLERDDRARDGAASAGQLFPRSAHHCRGRLDGGASNEAAQTSRARVNAREISAREVTDAALAQVDAVDGRVGAYLTRLHEMARAAADRVDARIAAGEKLAACRRARCR